jgi:hypothetical protein
MSAVCAGVLYFLFDFYLVSPYIAAIDKGEGI